MRNSGLDNSRTDNRTTDNRGALQRGTSPAAFSSAIVDRVVHIPPIVAIALYLPVVLITGAASLRQASPVVLAGCAVGGYFSWTLAEYWGHRLLLHFEPEQGWGAAFHRIIHGIHHEYPRDARRCVMSPLLSVPIVGAALGISIGLGLPAMFGAGFTAGYLVYDLVHVYLHRARPRSGPLKRLHELHMRHHFRDDSRGFGVTAPYWDTVFGTSAGRAGRGRT